MLTTPSPSATYTNGAHGFNICHIVCLKITCMVETFILQTTHMRETKIEEIPITQHHLGCHIQTVTSEAFTIEGHPGQVIGFKALSHVNTPIMSFMPPTPLLATQKHYHMPGEQFMRAICCHPS